VIGLVGSRKVVMSLLSPSNGPDGADPAGAPCAVENPHRDSGGGGRCC
jgi:hypothetical protein